MIISLFVCFCFVILDLEDVSEVSLGEDGMIRSFIMKSTENFPVQLCKVTPTNVFFLV